MAVSTSGVSLIPGLPTGGTAAQVLAKTSSGNYDVEWTDGGETPQTSTYTYTGDNLTRVDYANGDYKVLTYTGTQLDRVDFVQGATTIRKDFTYLSGNLTTVTVTLF